MLDYLKNLLFDLPDFAQKMILGLTGGNFNEKLEYIIAFVLFSLLAVFLFLPGTWLRLRSKIAVALLFAASPIIMLYAAPVLTGAKAVRTAAAWPHFAFIACSFVVLFILEEILFWRPLLKKRRNYYPSWLKPPQRYM